MQFSHLFLSALREAIPAQYRNDAAPSMFFTRDLEQIKRRTYDVVYEDLRAREFVPSSPEPAAVGATTLTYRQYDSVRSWKPIFGGASDLPRVDMKAKEFSSPLRRIGNSFGWNIDEMAAALYTGIPLSSEKARVARRGIEEGLDFIMSFGLTSFGMPDVQGFLNHSSVVTTTVAADGGGNVTWAAKAAVDPQSLITDVSTAINVQMELTRQRFRPTNVLLPYSQWALLNQTNRSGSVDRTIREQLAASHPGLQFDYWNRLDGAGGGGTDRMVVYTKSPEVLFYEIPQEFTMLPPQETGLETQVFCTAKSGGVVIPYPIAVSYWDGI